MKKLLLLLLLFTVLPVSVFADDYLQYYRNDCDPIDLTQDWGSLTSNDYVVTTFTPKDGDFNLSKVEVLMHSQTGSSTGNINMYVYSTNVGQTNMLLATAVNTVDASTLPNTATNVTFYFQNYTLTNGTLYGLVMGTSNPDATHYLWMDLCTTTGEAAKKGATPNGLAVTSNNYQWYVNISTYLLPVGGGGGNDSNQTNGTNMTGLIDEEFDGLDYGRCEGSVVGFLYFSFYVVFCTVLGLLAVFFGLPLMSGISGVALIFGSLYAFPCSLWLGLVVLGVGLAVFLNTRV